MATLKQLLEASAEELVRLLYKIRVSEEKGFIARIDAVAAKLGLNHAKLVCGLGFNFEITDLSDVLSIVGFTNQRALQLRRNELFKTDVYDQLNIDDIIDIYTHCLSDETSLEITQALITERLAYIERAIATLTHPQTIISYKMELHAIYSSALATENFAFKRLESKNRDLANTTKIQQDELKLIIGNKIVPAGNLFFSDNLTPEEKLVLIESGEINISMIKNRMQNTEISAAERDMLENNLR